MASACFRRFQPIVIDGKHQILNSRVGETWYLKDSKTGEITNISVESLFKRFEAGGVELLVGGKSVQELSGELTRSEPRGKPEDVCDDAWKLALAKRDLVKAVSCLGWQSDIQKEEVIKLWPKLVSRIEVPPETPDISSVHRWCVRLQHSGWDARCLLPMHWKKGRKPQPISEELYALIEEAVEDSYLTEC